MLVCSRGSRIALGGFEKFLVWTRTTNRDLVIGTLIMIPIATLDIVGGTYHILFSLPLSGEAVEVSAKLIMLPLAPMLGAVAAWGCVLCYRQRRFGLALFTSALGVIAVFYVASYIPLIVGITGVALIVFAKDDFKS